MQDRLIFWRFFAALLSFLLLFLAVLQRHQEFLWALKTATHLALPFLFIIFGLELTYWFIKGAIFSEAGSALKLKIVFEEALIWQIVLLIPWRSRFLLGEPREVKISPFFQKSKISGKELGFANFLFSGTRTMVYLLYFLVVTSIGLWLSLIPVSFYGTLSSLILLLSFFILVSLLIFSRFQTTFEFLERMLLCCYRGFPKLKILLVWRKELLEFAKIIKNCRFNTLTPLFLFLGALLAIRVVILGIILSLFGVTIPIVALFFIYLATHILSILSFSFRGIGTMEFFLTFLLILFKVPSFQAIAVALIYRIFTFYLPLILATLIYTGTLLRNKVLKISS